MIAGRTRPDAAVACSTDGVFEAASGLSDEVPEDGLVSSKWVPRPNKLATSTAVPAMTANRVKGGRPMRANQRATVVGKLCVRA